MFAKFKQLAGQSSLYTVGEVLRSSLSFLLLPIYTHLLTTADYAIIGVMSPVFSLLSILLALGMPAALLRFYFDYREDEALLRRYLGTVTVFGIGMGLIGSLLLTLIGPAFFGRLLPNTPFNPYVLITVWNAGLSVASVLVLQLFRARQQAHFFIAFNLIDFALTTALIILFVVGWRMGALGSLWGQLLAAVTMAAPAIWILARAGALGFSWQLLRPSLKLGVPLLPFLLGTWALNVSDRIVLDGLVTREALGIYTLGYQFGVLLNMLAVALNGAWQPFFYQHAADKAHTPMISAFITYQVALMTWLALALALLAPEMIRLIAPPAYSGAATLVPWIAAGYVMRYLYLFPVNSLLYKKRPGWIAALTILAAALNISLNFWLVPRYGTVAAAINTLLAFAALLVMVFFAGQHAFRVAYEWNRLARILLLALALFALGWFLAPAQSLWLGTSLKALLLAAFPLLLLLSGFLTRAERERARQVINRQANKYIKKQG
ncbi:MAG: oligosaccharide flippase family protein [Caldilineales bacterium]